MSNSTFQLTARVSEEEGAAFVAYAGLFSLTKTALAKLLILRELNRRSLRSMNVQPEGKSHKITVHYKDPDIKNRFDAHATSHGVSPGDAAAMIFLCELKEKWLMKSLEA